MHGVVILFTLFLIIYGAVILLWMTLVETHVERISCMKPEFGTDFYYNCS